MQIKGYRKLSEEEVDMINKIKQIGEELERVCLDLASREEIDKRWLAFGTTDLQKGLMFITRSIAKPKSF